MKALTLAVVVHASNLNKAITYYTNILGFTLDFTFGDYAGVAYDEVCIQLCGPTNDGKKNPIGNAHFCIGCN